MAKTARSAVSKTGRVSELAIATMAATTSRPRAAVAARQRTVKPDSGLSGPSRSRHCGVASRGEEPKVARAQTHRYPRPIRGRERLALEEGSVELLKPQTTFHGRYEIERCLK